MRGIYLKINKKDGDWYNKDLMDATKIERISWYNSLSKKQIVSIIENIVENGM